MNQMKTGKFIAEERKNKGYTQRRLAEILGISDKTVSKWECGNGFPEISLLLPLCEELGISVNELLAGERVAEEDYRKKAEENMMNLVKESMENKKKVVLSAMIAGLVLVTAVPLFVIGGAWELETWQRCLLIAIGLVILVTCVAAACILDRDAGAFECPACGERFVPEMRAYVLGPHTPMKRKLKCPKCGAVKYCRHVLTKSKV